MWKRKVNFNKWFTKHIKENYDNADELLKLEGEDRKKLIQKVILKPMPEDEDEKDNGHPYWWNPDDDDDNNNWY